MTLNLHVNIDPKSGFCFGVVNAIKVAEDYLQRHDSLYCLGDIVHNEMEINRLRKMGLITINYEQFRNLSDTIVLLRAHGEPPETYQIAVENNIKLIDASCRVVLKLQKKVKLLFEENANPIYIFGKLGHAEVIALIGQTGGKAIVFQSIDELKKMKLPKSLILISQTTKDLDELYRIKSYLEENHIKVDFNDTICRQVSNRNEELKIFVKKYDKVIFIAGKKSSNGKVLFDTCLNNNPNSFFISEKEELDTGWFSENDRVGICGATSTPIWLMEEIKAILEEY
jgi:4-hydroxy-3-methylbut-2-en-1-yl diphosphate reductase